MNILQPLMLLSKNIGFIAIGLIGINFLVGFHELGHYLFCKLFRIKTPTFSIGMGQFIVSKKIGDTVFGLARWPLGGYLEIAGLAEVGQGDQKDATLKGEQSFTDKPFWQKFLVMFGGILFNLIFAYCAFALIYMMGMPKSPLAYPENATSQIEAVVPDSPADTAGIKPSDIITGINGTAIAQPTSIIEAINAHAGSDITIDLTRDGQSLSYTVPVSKKEIMGQTRGIIGVAFGMKELPPYSFVESVKKAFNATNTHIVNTFKAFGHIFSKRDTRGAGGPIGIIKATMDGAQKGFKIFLLLLALISINLAVLNTLPLPILDGGQILFAAIEGIIGRPLPLQAREYIHIASWMGIMALIMFLSARDIYRIAEPIVKKLIG
jgi:regulator of sigma E protease